MKINKQPEDPDIYNFTLTTHWIPSIYDDIAKQSSQATDNAIKNAMVRYCLDEHGERFEILNIPKSKVNEIIELGISEYMRREAFNDK